MIVVRVELHSAVTNKVTELARMYITNKGTTGSLRSYKVCTFRGRDKEALDRRTIERAADVERWPSERVHVWNLVQTALTIMGYKR